MSWSIFKNNLNAFLENVDSIDSTERVSKKITQEYDLCMKRGFDTLNGIPILKGNTELMQSLLLVSLNTGLLNKTNFDFIGSLGPSITSYWTGAIMNTLPIPIIPAPGSISNILVVSNNIVSPGVWAPQPPLFPTNNNKLFVNLFVSAATLHLQSVSGIITTTSLYPPFGTPAPGVIFWTGYNVPQ
jgi:hypothetical protein